MIKIKCGIKGTIKLSFFLLLLCPFQNISAQLSKNAESSQFNFWVGKWELFSNGSKFGESKVDTLLDNFVIEEDFVEYPPDPFHGISLTTYNEDTKKWEQTMVDNQGHHSFFTGEFKDGAATLIRNFKNKKGEDRIQRTKYYNISKNSFDWMFDASGDGGKTWNVFYTFHYVRKK
jgi:hypothetical protein